MHKVSPTFSSKWWWGDTFLGASGTHPPPSDQADSQDLLVQTPKLTQLFQQPLWEGIYIVIGLKLVQLHSATVFLLKKKCNQSEVHHLVGLTACQDGRVSCERLESCQVTIGEGSIIVFYIVEIHGFKLILMSNHGYAWYITRLGQ